MTIGKYKFSLQFLNHFKYSVETDLVVLKYCYEKGGSLNEFYIVLILFGFGFKFKVIKYTY